MCYSLPIGSEINEKIGNPVQFGSVDARSTSCTYKQNYYLDEREIEFNTATRPVSRVESTFTLRLTGLTATVKEFMIENYEFKKTLYY